MRTLLLFFFLSGCSAEINLAKEEPIMVGGATAVFIGAIIGLSQ